MLNRPLSLVGYPDHYSKYRTKRLHELKLLCSIRFYYSHLPTASDSYFMYADFTRANSV